MGAIYDGFEAKPITKKELIHKLVKTLEQLERYLTFTVFYTYEDFASKSFCPAFDFEGFYYEIQDCYMNEFRGLKCEKCNKISGL